MLPSIRFALLAALLAGCAAESADPVPPASQEASSATLDASEPADAGEIPSPDAGPLDSGALDSGLVPDAGDTSDAGADAGLDAGLDGDPDAGQSIADAGDDPHAPPALFSVEPASGGASVPTPVVLHGQGFGEVLWIQLGDDYASDVVRLDSRTLRATFPAVDMKAVGRREVRVVLVGGGQAALHDGFEYVFDEDPVVFVHGFVMSPFGTMIDRFREAGYPDSHLFRIEYSDPFGSNLRNVIELEAFVASVLQQTGAPRVDLVIHSMGGLSSRLYIKNRAGHLYVRDYVGIAGAFHGTSVANLAPSDGAREMRPAYACEGEALNDVQFELNGCLTDDGRTVPADETPFGIEDGGPVSYLSISSEHDEIILPTASSCLNQSYKNDCSDPVNVRVRWLGHGTILADSDVFDLTIEHLRKRNRSKE